MEGKSSVFERMVAKQDCGDVLRTTCRERKFFVARENGRMSGRVA